MKKSLEILVPSIMTGSATALSTAPWHLCCSLDSKHCRHVACPGKDNEVIGKWKGHHWIILHSHNLRTMTPLYLVITQQTLHLDMYVYSNEAEI